LIIGLVAEFGDLSGTARRGIVVGRVVVVLLPVAGVDGTATLHILLDVVQNQVNLSGVVSHVVLLDGRLYALLGRRLQLSITQSNQYSPSDYHQNQWQRELTVDLKAKMSPAPTNSIRSMTNMIELNCHS
jgi:hypothetical protein